MVCEQLSLLLGHCAPQVGHESDLSFDHLPRVKMAVHLFKKLCLEFAPLAIPTDVLFQALTEGLVDSFSTLEGPRKH